MVFYIVLFGFIGYQAYKYFSHTAPCYLNGYDRKVKRINEVLFDNQYVYILDKDICLDSTSLWINLGDVRTFTFNENGLTTEFPNQKHEYDAKGRLVCSKECEGSYAEYRYLDNYEAEMYLYHDSTKTDLTKYLHYDHFGFVDSVYVNCKYDYYLEARSYESNYTTYASGRIKDRTVIEKRKRYHGGELENKPKKDILLMRMEISCFMRICVIQEEIAIGSTT